MHRFHPLALLVLLALPGCQEQLDVLRPDGSTPTPPPPGAETTYYEDLRPILVEQCVTCHVRGGIAPFDLETYDAAVEVGERMREVTRDRIMPPFLADNSGSCQTFSNYRGLSQEEIDVFARWVDDGMLEGDPATPEPAPVEFPTLPHVDVTLEMPMAYAVDQGLDDDYRCFVVDPGTTEDTFVTGYDVHPGNAQRVHHLIVYNPVDEAAVTQARDLDAADGVVGDGYPCFGGPRVTAPPLVLWAPGTGPTRFPRGTGLQLAAGRAQIIQVHYNNLVPDAPGEDRSTVDLMTSSSASPAYLGLLADTDLLLPPRRGSITQSRTVSLSYLPTSVRVWGQFPHMHTLGRSLRVELESGECLIDVPRWDFNWQLVYWYDQPITLSPSDRATLSCTFDTTERDDTTTWGDGTLDEMCLSFFYVSL